MRPNFRMHTLFAFASCLVISSLFGGEPTTAKVEMSIPPAVQRSIDRGLAFLARTQRADGSWPSEFGRTTGIVGSCALAFMACGHTPDSGKYARQAQRAIDFILRSARADGLLYQEGMAGSPMYHHGIATLALAEAWGANDEANKRIRAKLTRAVDLIVRAQNGRGGWRYMPHQNGGDDLSVTVIQMLGLRGAREIGIYVPQKTIDKGIGYIRMCWDQNGKQGFRYQPSGKGFSFNMTGAGVLSLQMAGEYNAVEVTNGLKFMFRAFFGLNDAKLGSFYYYGRYYAAQCAYQAQSKLPWATEAWNTFYPALAKELMAKQTPSGAWQSMYDEYGTAQSILVLAIPNRFLPIYQR